MNIKHEHKTNTTLVLLITVVFVVLVLLQYLPSRNASANMLELEIEMKRSNYQVDQPIPVLVRLKNSGSSVIVVQKRMVLNSPGTPNFAKDVEFHIANSLSEPVRFMSQVDARLVNPEDIKFLLPGKSIEVTYDINIDYEFNPGESYSVYAIYQNSSESDKSKLTWKGTLISNTLLFDISP